MASFTLCYGVGCKKKEECRRFTSPPTKDQAYFQPQPDDCMFYWAPSTRKPPAGLDSDLFKVDLEEYQRWRESKK